MYIKYKFYKHTDSFILLISKYFERLEILMREVRRIYMTMAGIPSPYIGNLCDVW